MSFLRIRSREKSKQNVCMRIMRVQTTDVGIRNTNEGNILHLVIIHSRHESIIVGNLYGITSQK